MRAREERMAAELRARGWTCTPPDAAPAPPSTPAAGVDLVAVVRPTAREPRLSIVGPPAPGSHPRANLDGLGAHERAAFLAPGVPLPRRADSPAQTRPFVDLIESQGYTVAGPWTVAADLDGRSYAYVPVRETGRG